MDNETPLPVRLETAPHIAPELAPRRLPVPRSPRRLLTWVTATLAALRRAENRITERFRVPPNGA